MIKNFIFDFGGVVIKHSSTLTYDILTEMFPLNQQEVQEIWKEYRPLLNTGKKISTDFLLEAKRKVNDKRGIEELEKKWKRLYRQRANIVDWDLLNFIEKLKAKYNVYLLTDTIDAHDDYNKTRGIYEKFDGVYKSFEEGLWKASGKEAFENILKKINSKPSECIFIDDLDSNVNMAEQIGIRGITYRNVLQLEEEVAKLEKRKLLVSF